MDKDAVNEWYVLLAELGLVLDALLDNEKALSIKMSSDGMSVQVIVREDLPFGRESEAYAAYDTESAMALAVLLAGLPDDWVAVPPQDDGGRDGEPAF